MFWLEGVIIGLFVEPCRRYIKYSAHFEIPKSLQAHSFNRYKNLKTKIMKCCANICSNVNFLGSQNVHCTWCIYNMVQWTAWWWLLRVETWRYTHNFSIINICVWLKLYILSNLIKHIGMTSVNPLNAELNPICHLLALLAHHFLHVSRIRVKSLTLRLLMSYIYIYIYIYIWSAYSWCF